MEGLFDLHCYPLSEVLGVDGGADQDEPSEAPSQYRQRGDTWAGVRGTWCPSLMMSEDDLWHQWTTLKLGAFGGHMSSISAS